MLHICPVAWQAQYNSEHVAVKTDQYQLTYAQLHNLISSLSSQLIQLNMNKGDRLATIAKNRLPLYLLQLTCLRNGFIFCPINPNFSQAEIAQRLNRLDTAFIYREGAENNLSLDFSKTSGQAPNDAPLSIDPNAIISIIFTSGSSGLPKAVMHHFRNHFYSALGSQSVIPLNVGDNNLLSLPMFHISGYATVMRTVLAGATLLISEEKISVQQLNKTKITHLSLVSTQLQQLLQDKAFQQNLLPIKHLLLGGSAFPTNVLTETGERGFTYHLSYGSTEMASQIATSTNNETLKLLPYRLLKIIDGEIHLAGQTRFAGYFNGDSQSGLIDQSYYFASADLGEIDILEDKETVKIMGRKDRQFISGGENIQPEEIEKVLLACPSISQAYVLPIDDCIYGQRPIAFVKWTHGEHPQKLSAFIQDRLVAFKHPLHYFSFPQQQGLKPNRSQLSALATTLLRKEIP
ncbi:2-succinylbenzoate-CoA ligase [Psychromonas marina]|uniref:2-succinylbenzoate-CoA ligase n=2 Tax=Psychromonas marina TaxID=88364 RepID=A0ABQ6DZZ5_9GAMM|nr:2-succinylbenzoate-CoA ligase [Psychromonas marina]